MFWTLFFIGTVLWFLGSAFPPLDPNGGGVNEFRFWTRLVGLLTEIVGLLGIWLVP